MGYIVFTNGVGRWYWNGVEVTEEEFNTKAAELDTIKLKAQAYDILTGVSE